LTVNRVLATPAEYRVPSDRNTSAFVSAPSAPIVVAAAVVVLIV